MRNGRSNHAQALIEFALIIPLVILMVTFFIDAGRAIFTYSELANAVREGTRFAIVHDTATTADLDAIDNIIRHYSPMLEPDDMTINITPPDSTTHQITISVIYLFHPITPGLSYILGSQQSISLEAHSSAMMAPLYQP